MLQSTLVVEIYQKMCKCKIFLMAVYMIFKYSKRFRFPPSFNNYNIGLFDQKTLLSSTISKRK